MTKDELKEMIDATITENGGGNITGKALNLALTEIINAMGENGGGMDTISYIPNAEVSASLEEILSEENIATKIQHNIDVYNKVTEKFKTSGDASPLAVDLTLIISYQIGILAGEIAEVYSVTYMVLEESSPQSLSFNPYDYYEVGQVAVMVKAASDSMGQELSFVLLPDGTCVTTESSVS